MLQEITTFDQAIREMLKLDLHYNKTCGLENGTGWRTHRDRWDSITKFCKVNPTTYAAFVFFRQSNMKAIEAIRAEANKRPVTEGFVEALISNI